MTKSALGLGSNLGDRRRHLAKAIATLGERVEHILAVSSLFETEPIGGPAQGPYLNAVAIVETQLDPHQLLKEIHRIERHHGRVRTVRWGPRTLDIDIVAREDGPIVTPDLVVPHPRAHERLFVLEPLRQVWPGVVLADGKPARAERALRDQGVVVVDDDTWSDPPT